jgi:hypothetical protein
MVSTTNPQSTDAERLIFVHSWLRLVYITMPYLFFLFVFIYLDSSSTVSIFTVYSNQNFCLFSLFFPSPHHGSGLRVLDFFFSAPSFLMSISPLLYSIVNDYLRGFTLAVRTSTPKLDNAERLEVRGRKFYLGRDKTAVDD